MQPRRYAPRNDPYQMVIAKEVKQSQILYLFSRNDIIIRLQMKILRICFSLIFISLVYGNDGENRYYSTTRVSGSEILTVDHLKLDRSIFSVEPSTKWSGFYFTKDALVRYVCRTDQESSIQIRQIPLKNSLLNENEAKQLYLDEILKAQPKLYIRGERTSEHVTVPSSFPMTFVLGMTSNQPPTIMSTFFVSLPYLYSVELKAPYRLTGNLRGDYYSILHSIRIEPQSSESILK